MVGIKMKVFNSLTSKVDMYYKTLFRCRMTDSREEVDEIDATFFRGLTTRYCNAHNQSIGEYHRYRKNVP